MFAGADPGLGHTHTDTRKALAVKGIIEAAAMQGGECLFMD